MGDDEEKDLDKDSDAYLEDDVEEDSYDEAEEGPVRMGQIQRTVTFLCGLFCHHVGTLVMQRNWRKLV